LKCQEEIEQVLWGWARPPEEEQGFAAVMACPDMPISEEVAGGDPAAGQVSEEASVEALGEDGGINTTPQAFRDGHAEAASPGAMAGITKPKRPPKRMRANKRQIKTPRLNFSELNLNE